MSIVEDAIYIQSCINECSGTIQKTLEIARRTINQGGENSVGRYDTHYNKTVLSDECMSNTYPSLDNDRKNRCDHQKQLQYLPTLYKCEEITITNLWTDIVTNMESINGMEHIYIMVSHHRRMRKHLLPTKKHYSNTCVIEILCGDMISAKMIHTGFPDPEKTNYKYIQQDDTIDIDPLIIGVLNKACKKNVRILLVRHGNALHNGPLRLKNVLDTCLTPLGELQAKLCGFAISAYLKKSTKPHKIHFIASELNRAQHTALHIAQIIGIGQKLPKLTTFLNMLSTNAAGRIEKRRDGIQPILELLENQIKTLLIKNNVYIIRLCELAVECTDKNIDMPALLTKYESTLLPSRDNLFVHYYITTHHAKLEQKRHAELEKKRQEQKRQEQKQKKNSQRSERDAARKKRNMPTKDRPSTITISSQHTDIYGPRQNLG